MAIRFVLDENVRGPLWRAILRHNASGGPLIDATCVGEASNLPLGLLDDALLGCCEREGRILVSLDHATLPNHLAHRLAAGGHSPGILLIRPGASIPEILELLELVAHVGDPADYCDRVTYVP